MTKIELVRKQMMQALKSRDMDRKEALSILLTALKNVAIDKRADLTEEEENTVIFKEIKKAQETIDLSPKDRTDIIGQCSYRIGVFSEFAPRQMSEQEIDETIEKVLQALGLANPTVKEKGIIMKNLMPLVKGKADGALVNARVGKRLG